MGLLNDTPTPPNKTFSTPQEHIICVAIRLSFVFLRMKVAPSRCVRSKRHRCECATLEVDNCSFFIDVHRIYFNKTRWSLSNLHEDALFKTLSQPFLSCWNANVCVFATRLEWSIHCDCKLILVCFDAQDTQHQCLTHVIIHCCACCGYCCIFYNRYTT